jgi:MFS superfamily sulfate permease-like transporter
VSLCILALEVTFPATAPHLSLSTLFSIEHIPLLVASALPAVFICTSIRVPFFATRTSGLTLDPMYVPICCFAILIVFWIAAAAVANANMEALASSGWLFRIKASGHRVSSAAGWNYWALFDFSKVEWRTLTTVIGDISLFVLIGALTLPVFASATANDLKLFNHDMNHEFIGHGIANLAAGILGTLPATMVCSFASARR